MTNIDSSNLNTGQKVAVKYFSVAMILFLAQMLFGLLAGLQYVHPEFLYNVLDFNVNRMVHINAVANVRLVRGPILGGERP